MKAAGPAPADAGPTGGAEAAPESEADRLTPKGRAMRERLIEAAARAFAEYGYSGTRVADITRFSETSHGNFYRYFENKNEVLLAVLEPRLAALQQAARKGAAHTDLGPRARLVASNTAYFYEYASNRKLLSVMREATALGERSNFRELWLAERAAFTARVERFLGRLVQSGAVPPFPNPHLLAESLGSMTEQLAYVHIALPDVCPRPEALDALGEVCGDVWFRAIYDRDHQSDHEYRGGAAR